MTPAQQKILNENIEQLWLLCMEQARCMSLILQMAGHDAEAFFKECAENTRKGRQVVREKAEAEGRTAQKH